MRRIVFAVGAALAAKRAEADLPIHAVIVGSLSAALADLF